VTDAPTVPASEPAPPAKKPAFRFTDDGCVTELRLGALLVLMGTFLWNFVGPTWAMRLAVVGGPLLLIGVVMQALAARRGVPGMPWKLGVAMLVLGVAMTWDFRYRDIPGGPMAVVLVGPILAVSGAWILLWQPLASAWLRRARSGEDA
jgi:hypothetical protein